MDGVSRTFRGGFGGQAVSREEAVFRGQAETRRSDSSSRMWAQLFSQGLTMPASLRTFFPGMTTAGPAALVAAGLAFIGLRFRGFLGNSMAK